MQATPMRRDGCRAQWQHIVVCLIVAVVHLGLALLLVRAPWTWSRATSGDRTLHDEVLRIRFLRRELPRSAPLPTPVLRPRARQRAAVKAAPSQAPLHRLPAPAAGRSPTHVEPDQTAAADAPAYISGGGFLDRAAQHAPADVVRLPGSSQPIVRGLHMVDPRSRGVGGVVRAVQTVFGVPDPHCVNVDGWRGMSVKELLDRHMSPDQVEKTAEEYHCGPPR